MSKRIERTIHYPHPIDRVWHAISDAAQISEWFIAADFRAEVGFHYTFTHESTIVRGEVLEVDPPRLLVYTWVVGDNPARTTVRWRLQATNAGTELHLEHWGFEQDPASAVAMFEASTKGWEAVTAELATYLDRSHAQH